MRLLYRVSFAALLALLAGCSRAPTIAESHIPVPMSTPSAAPVKTLNMPGLVGCNIDQLRSLLGTPREATDETLSADPSARQPLAARGEEWTNTFEKDGSTLVATFNVHTRKVLDVVLVGTDEDELMRRGGLTLNDPSYIVLPVTDPQNLDRLTGIRLVPRR